MTILNIYNSYYKHIPLDVFNATVAADPTSYNQGKIVKVGNFVKWILKLYTNGSWKVGDSYETKDLLSKFIKYKSKLPIEKRDINRYNSIIELYSLIQTLEGQGVKTQSDVKKEGAEVVYEDVKWKIVIPHTKEASCIYGAHTRWCTAGREDNMFDYYNKQGLLYININKQTGDKYQFHFESDSFMDAEDKRISLKKIGLSEGVIGYYKSIGKEPYFIYDYVGKLSDGYVVVKLDGKYNFINTQGELLWNNDNWFDGVSYFYNGFAEVKIEGRGWNFINTNGELVWKGEEWFDHTYTFDNGFAHVYKRYKGFNIINEQGELLWDKDEWFVNTGDFIEGFACVNLEGKGCNHINEQGKLLWDKYIWFDYVGEFSEGVARVEIEGKGWNFINPQGELLWKRNKLFDHVYDFSNGFARVYKEGKGYNFINPDGELVYKGNKWFDDVLGFSNGFARVFKEGKLYKLNNKGELVN